ncbi:hypothetical protein T492DRAFT_864787 [Pavlovales sp. CCMP2436]|nr:hypothetical protein T492DRAFT_864787 [Pavlovales sp. CCMP2436]
MLGLPALDTPSSLCSAPPVLGDGKRRARPPTHNRRPAVQQAPRRRASAFSPPSALPIIGPQGRAHDALADEAMLVLAHEVALTQAAQARREANAERRKNAEYYFSLSERLASVREFLAGLDEEEAMDTGEGGGDAEVDAALEAAEKEPEGTLAILVPLPGESSEAYRLRVARRRTADLPLFTGAAAISFPRPRFSTRGL